ncbi:armadillo-type protein [Lobosporangium transversale]|uniref:Importin-13 n=1 Tax=Lobosporangium transversale TaxID=64571 RepID=A0A1Y2GE84_9FUNG|nr:armadillo-type protein [Lobosporangium transversale]ORZ07309.1 armadillo-type protein [Lobosporangium transversale]|eukprot:XP_021877972.1 armadillo-type protein [Lobosporangium transversale]
MAVPSLLQLEEVIQQFYAGQDSAYQKSAQEYLHNLQKEPFAWELAPRLLSSQSENSQFFGAHTYQVKIARDWKTIPEDRIEWVRGELIRWIARYSNGPAFIRTKLCLALSAYAIRAVPTYWSDFIRSFYQDLHAHLNQNIDGVFMSQQAMEAALLDFMTIVAEELSRAEIEPMQRSRLSGEVSTGIPLIMSFIQKILVGNDSASKQKALICFKSWVQYGVAFDVIQPVLGLALNSLLHDETFDAAADVWSEIMSSTAAAKHQNTVCEGLMPCFASEWARAKHLESIQAENEDISKSLCQLLSTFGDNFSDWIAARFLRSDIVVYLEMMMGFAGFPGYYAEDETISDLTLNFWYMLQESLSELQPDDADDEDQGGMMSHESLDDDRHVILSTISSASSITGLNKESLQTIKEASVHVYTRLAEVLRKKLEYPPHKEWISWARDIRQEFTGHRQEIADTLINSYHVLHDQILSLLIDTCIIQLDEIGKVSISGSDINENLPLETAFLHLEATLYCLKALSEVVPHSENIQLPRFFSNQVFGRLPTNVICRARETALGLVGSYADWFKSHPQFLLSSLNFVIPALEVPQLAPYAAKALKNICDTCRELLVEAIDAFMTVFANVERAIDPAIKGSVVFSIATVIQTLPVERSINPLVGLLGDIFTRSNECLETRKQRLATGGNELTATHHQGANGETELEPLSAMMLQQLEFLLSCCRGLQSPLEEEIRTEDERIQIYQKSIEDRNKVLATGGMAVELTRSMEQVIQGTIMVWPHEPIIIEKVCQVVKSMMTVSQFSPLYLPFPTLIHIVETGFRQHAFPCWLDAAAKIVSVYYFETTGGSLFSKLGSGAAATSLNESSASSLFDRNGKSSMVQVVDLEAHSNSINMPIKARTQAELESETVFTHFLSALVSRTMEGIQSMANMEESPDIVHSFFAVLSQFVRHAPLAFYSIPPEQTDNLMNFAIAGLALQERLALKATLLFLVEFVNQNHDYPALQQRVDALMTRIGPQMMRGILFGIGGHVPRSMVPQLNDTLYPLIGKYPQQCRNWMQSLLAEPGFPSKYADQASKEKFIKGIMGTRSPKRFKDEVHQFSNKCRQLDGSVFGSAI